MKILIDTCVLIDDSYPEIPGARYFASTLSKAELEAGVKGVEDENTRQQRATRLAELNDDFDWLPFTQEAATAYGFLAAQLRQAGKKSLARRVDIYLAAHALSIDAAFMTSNRKDFQYLQDSALLSVIFIDPVYNAT
jgi:predicted nucleic acid-binding protein